MADEDEIKAPEAERETVQQQVDALKFQVSELEARVAAMEQTHVPETHTRIGNLEKFVRDEIRRIGL